MDTLIAPLQPVIAAPEQVPAIRPFNLDMKVLLTTEDTAGAMSVIMAWHKPGEGPPDHVHFNQEEIFFIVDGLYELTIDGQTSIGGPGTLVFIPRNTVHSFKNVGEQWRSNSNSSRCAATAAITDFAAAFPLSRVEAARMQRTMTPEYMCQGCD